MLHFAVAVRRCLLAGVLLAGLSAVPTTADAVVPPCSTSYDATKSKCRPVIETPWRFYVYTGVPSLSGPFSSEGEAVAYPPSIYLPSQPNLCAYDYTHTVHDEWYTPATYVGIVVKRQHNAYYDVTMGAQANPPCQTHTTSGLAFFQVREVKCPDPIDGTNWTLLHDAGNLSTPYCAIPWTQVFKTHQCALEKGNPCDILTGAKIQTETDYSGAGAFPLRFARTFRGDVAYTNNFTSTSRSQINPVGIGWSASYFQYLFYGSSGSQSGVTAYRPDGTRRDFRQDGSNFIADDDVSDRLIRLTDGSGNTTGWQYLTAAEDTETYDAAGRLTSISTRSGLTQSVAYPSGTARYPSSVTDDFGRTLVFSYHAGRTAPAIDHPPDGRADLLCV